MSWVKRSERVFQIFFILPILAVCILTLQLRGLEPEGGGPAAAEAGEKTPFTIEQADDFIQRTDSLTGSGIYILQGNVRIRRGESHIRCGTLTYFPGSRHFLCIESVLLTDSERRVSSDTLMYYVDAGRYRALGSLRWESMGLAGTGLAGDYYRSTDLLVIEGEAVARDSLRRLEADKIEYDYATGRVRAEGSVVLTDTRSGSMATAASGLYDRGTDISILTGRPKVVFYLESDSLKLRPYNLTCDRLLNFGADSMVATGRVVLADDSLRATSDSLFHDRASGRSYFRSGGPRIDHPAYSMRGGKIDILTSGRRLELVVATGSARGEFFQAGRGVDTSGTGMDNWIEGDTLNVAFGPAGLDSIVAAGEARSYLRQSLEESVNYVIGSRILLLWQGGLIDRMEVAGGGRGLYLMLDTTGQISADPDSAAAGKHNGK
ncbi:MAG: LptA/OstA family protein [Gemmatimonadota bacterium]|nr:LptA/OstA family protein [Gemmatimonadota bacterium]